ncbi:hypothetical protein COT62_01100 [Candidatus Roizmanbacteria bacterium CG09_land_8_20_14_0_10_41_9]|uniref:Schlafen AlbA-2 domain-containing protein n=1 Tax=Candidatus Roizmanbacteria bacterium CG09_land_8_20_14_0_10_41_9 TaxID=1974850 RepID=A0A2H0WTE6_9BACT|nr:MAG: hypothetical protein COT62_01100 [Candidatus Roizmanbacteria bacterium CG09_land_8_20_14_0_10_41_9]
MIYTKPINEITYQDVVDFCNEGHSEGFILEYKRDFTSLPNEKIAKTVAAFANTYGGVLIVGVDAPSGKPVAPFEGFVFDPSMKYEEKIESVVLSHIKEPVFPEVKVCDPVNGKTFIVVRVAESYLTPHRVSDNTKIYVRTGQSSTPNEEAAYDKIEWLIARRKKSEEFRELLIQEGERYFKDACKLWNIRPEDKDPYFAIFSIRITPLFPQNPLIPFKNLDNIENDITVHGRHSFPPHLYDSDPVQNGIQKLYIMRDNAKEPAHGKAFEYTYLNAFGLYLYKHDIGDVDERIVKKPDGSEEKIKTKSMNFYYISSILHQFLASAILFYQKLGYWGTVQITVELTNALGVRMVHPLRGVIYEGDEVLLVPSDHLKWEKKVGVHFLKERMRDVVVEIVDAAAWSLGVRYFTEERIRKNLKDNFGE